jgi:Cys-rich protein (TIGR01571 family)
LLATKVVQGIPNLDSVRVRKPEFVWNARNYPFEFESGILLTTTRQAILECSFFRWWDAGRERTVTQSHFFSPSIHHSSTMMTAVNSRRPSNTTSEHIHSRRSTMERRSNSVDFPTSSSSRMIRVVAPATLEEDYTFDVLIEGKTYTVTVPKGGVKENEEFEIPHPDYCCHDSDDYEQDDDDDDENEKDGAEGMTMKPTQSEEDEQVDELGAPLGRWRSSLCACCDVLTQATFWMGFFLTPVLVAQLLTRLGLSWKGRMDSREEVSLSFNKIVLSFIAALILGNIPVVGIFFVIVYCMGVMLWTGRNVRATMRKRYKIPPQLPARIDDCVCMLFCGCCSVIQMARHTHNDKDYPGSCCTTTGLDLDAPQIV